MMASRPRPSAWMASTALSNRCFWSAVWLSRLPFSIAARSPCSGQQKCVAMPCRWSLAQGDPILCVGHTEIVNLGGPCHGVGEPSDRFPILEHGTELDVARNQVPYPLDLLLERRDVDLGNRSVALSVGRINVAYRHPELGAVQRDGQGHGLRARVGRRPTEVASGWRIVLARAGGVLAELAGYRGGPDRSRGFLHVDEHESVALDRPRSWRESQRPCAPLRWRLSPARPIPEPQERGDERDHRCHPKGTSATRRVACPPGTFIRG